jgi:hypothetical protein
MRKDMGRAPIYLLCRLLRGLGKKRSQKLDAGRE